MQFSDTKPTGTVVGFIRLQKKIGAQHIRLVDFTRYELTKNCIRFREENWVVTQDATVPAMMGRNTDNFMSMDGANECFAWWLKTKLDDHYTVLQVNGSPGPLPNAEKLSG